MLTPFYPLNTKTFLLSQNFFNFFFFFIYKDLKFYFEYLQNFSFFKVFSLSKPLVISKKFKKKLILKKNYKQRVFKKNFNLRLKSFFFLKNIKKQKNFYLFTSKNNNLSLPPIFFFKLITFLKKNLISFIGLPFFKNYYKFSSLRKIIFPKGFSKKKRIRLWKLKKAFSAFKKKKIKNHLFKHLFFKKISSLLFVNPNRSFFKNKWTNLRIKNLTSNYKETSEFFFLSPIKFFFLKKKIYHNFFRNINKTKKKSFKKYKHKNKKINWVDYRLTRFNFGNPSTFSRKFKPFFFNLNRQKFKNFYKNNLFSNNTEIQTSVNSYLSFYRFFFFQKKKSSKKRIRKFVLNFKLRRRRKKMSFFIRKKKKFFFLKKILKMSSYKRYNFLYKNNFFLFKNNFQNFNKKFNKLIPSKLSEIRKKNFYYINKKKNSFWTFLFKKKFNKLNTLLIKKFKYSKILPKKLKKSFKYSLISKKLLGNFFKFRHFWRRKKSKIFFSKNFFRMKTYKKKIMNKKKKNFYSKFFFPLALAPLNLKYFKFKKFTCAHYFLKSSLYKASYRKNVLFKSFYFYEKKKTTFFVFNLKSKIKNLFVLGINGFMYLDHLNSLNFFRKENAWIIRKLIYSFASKNDLQNFILKKYIKNKYTSIQSEKNMWWNDPENISSPNMNPYEFKAKFVDWGFNQTTEFFEQESYSFNPNYFNNLLKNFTHTLLPSLYTSLYTFNLSTIDWTEPILEPLYIQSLVSPNVNLNIKKTKFKPGYPSMWRSYRSTLKVSLDLKFRYQHQLTKYLLRFNKIIKNRLYFLFEMQLDNVLTLSKLFPDRSWSVFFIDEGLIFINGTIAYSAFDQLFKNDFIQLIVSLKYYISYRWLLNWYTLKKNKLRKRLHSKINAKNLPDDKQKSYNLPIWILKNKNFSEDVAKYLEVDYFSLSFFVLYEPLFLTDVNALSFLTKRFSIINLFNWKYIN